MLKRPYSNDTDKLVYVGGVPVPAGETKLVPDYTGGSQATAQVQASAEIQLDQARLQTVLGGSIKEVEAELPKLSDAEIDALVRLENEAEAPRKGIADAVDAELDAREELQEKLNALEGPEGLLEAEGLLKLQVDNPGRVSRIQPVVAKLAG